MAPREMEHSMVRVAERVHCFNCLAQETHRNNHDNLGTLRAKAGDPTGPHGYMTRCCERIPVVNNIIQEVHKARGNHDALARAKERNPIGTDGLVTMMMEKLPLIADGLEALHRKRGKTHAAERAGVLAMGRMFSSNGVGTKAVELLPGINLLFAALHEVAGNPAAAARAKNLLRSWRAAGTPDGALVRLAELSPVAIVPFSALRSIVKTTRVTVTMKTFYVEADIRTLEQAEVVAIESSGIDARPNSVSVVGGLLDIAAHWLQIDEEGHRRRRRREACTAPLSPFTFRCSKHSACLRAMVEELTRKQISEELNQALCGLRPDSLRETLPTIVLESLEDVKKALVPSLLKRYGYGTRPMPPLTPRLEKKLRRAAPGISVTHGPQPQDKRSAAKAPPKCGTTARSSGCLAGFMALFGRGGSDVRARRPEPQPAEGAAADDEAGAEAEGGPRAVTLEIREKDIREISGPMREWLWADNWSADPGTCTEGVLRGVEQLVRSAVTYSVGREAAGQIPVTLEADLLSSSSKAQYQGLAHLKMGVHLDLSLVDEGYVRRARLSVTDEALDEVVQELWRRFQKRDLRQLDPRLAAFTEPVRVRGDIALRWTSGPGPQRLRLELRDLSATLHLPM